MIFFVFAGKQWISDVKFIKDTAKAPHVYCCLIRNSKYDFWCPVKPRLYIGIDFFVLKTARTKVDNFDARLVDFSKENIFWLEVTMYNIVFV